MNNKHCVATYFEHLSSLHFIISILHVGCNLECILKGIGDIYDIYAGDLAP